MKKLAALILSATLLVGSAAAISPEEAFPKVNEYPGYTDVEAGSWYADPAQVCYEVGLMTGTNTGFTPFGILTVGEVAAIAARMNEAITGDPIPMATPKPGETLPWYFSYVKYLEDLGIDVPDPEKQATRQEFVSILAAVVPEEMLSPINTITTLPDTKDEAVLRFYNAGILTGVDDWGTFAANNSLTRAETAAMVARVARTDLRQTFTLCAGADRRPGGRLRRRRHGVQLVQHRGRRHLPGLREEHRPHPLRRHRQAGHRPVQEL